MPKHWEDMTQKEKIERLHEDIEELHDLLHQFRDAARKDFQRLRERIGKIEADLPF